MSLTREAGSQDGREVRPQRYHQEQHSGQAPRNSPSGLNGLFATAITNALLACMTPVLRRNWFITDLGHSPLSPGPTETPISESSSSMEMMSGESSSRLAKDSKTSAVRKDNV